jgi:hypothetical protein
MVAVEDLQRVQNPRLREPLRRLLRASVTRINTRIGLVGDGWRPQPRAKNGEEPWLLPRESPISSEQSSLMRGDSE